MKTKRQKQVRAWAHPYLPPKWSREAKRRAQIELQCWGFAADGKTLLWAGVHHAPEISPRIIWKIAAHWRRWRRWYDNRPDNRALDYPAKHDPKLGFCGVHPMRNEKAIHWLAV